MDKFEAMRALVAIVDHGTLTAAGKALGRSLPSMVRTLAELEAQLGVTLLRRTTRRMSLTDEGTQYVARCRRILLDVDETEAWVRAQHAPLRGRLRITAPVRFGTLHVAPAVNEFVRKHGEVEVELLLLDRVVNLVDEGFDLAVRIGTLPDSSLVATEVGTMRTVVCASPRLLRKVGVPTHPRDLSHLPCVGFPSLNGRPWRFSEPGGEFAITVRGRLNCNQAEAAVDACAAGLGFGRFLHYQVQSAVGDKKLRMLLETFEMPAAKVSLVWGAAPFVSPRLRALIDWLKPRLSDGSRHGSETR